MRVKFVEFLFKRIDTKVHDIGEEVSDYTKVEDLESYLSELKEIVLEAIKP